MKLDPQSLNPREAYQALCAIVIPRPIAWIATMSPTGQRNLAPFSYFGAVTSDPPMLMVNIARRRGGAQKDTTVNLLETGEAVVHIPHRPLAKQMVASSADFAPDVDEFEACELESLPSDLVKPPRLKAAAIAMECKMLEHRELGNAPVDSFLLQILMYHLDEAMLREDGLPDAPKVAPVSRLGGAENAAITEVFELPRPPRPAR